MRKYLLCFLLSVVLLSAPGSTFAQDSDACRVRPLWDTMPIFAIPLEAYGTEIAYVPSGTEYPVLKIRDIFGGTEDGDTTPMYQIQLDEDTTGWTAFFSASLTGDCEDITRDTTPRDTYQGLCYATTESGHTISVLSSRVDGLEMYCGHAMDCRVSLDEADLVQPCEILPFKPGVISTTASIPLYHDPSAESEVVTQLKAKQSVVAIDSSSQTSSENLWFRILTKDGKDGWILAANTELVESTEGWEPIGTGTLNAHTNLWTTPDVMQGRVFTSVPEDTEVNILYGPVTGPIRRDSDLTGAWYYVSVNFSYAFMRWWVWEGNLTIDDK